MNIEVKSGHDIPLSSHFRGRRIMTCLTKAAMSLNLSGFVDYSWQLPNDAFSEPRQLQHDPTLRHAHSTDVDHDAVSGTLSGEIERAIDRPQSAHANSTIEPRRRNAGAEHQRVVGFAFVGEH